MVHRLWGFLGELDAKGGIRSREGSPGGSL